VTGAKRGGGGGGEEGEKRERGREVRSFTFSLHSPSFFSFLPFKVIIDSTSTKNNLKKRQEKTIKTKDAALSTYENNANKCLLISHNGK